MAALWLAIWTAVALGGVAAALPQEALAADAPLPAAVSAPAEPASETDDGASSDSWRGLSFDQAAFEEVVRIAGTYHLSAEITPAAWRKAAERVLKGLEPRSILLPAAQWQRLRRDRQGQLRLAEELTPLPCGEPALALARLATPTEPAETAWQRREERKTFRQWQADIAAANQQVQLDRAGLHCVLKWAEQALPALQQPGQRAALWRRAAQGLLEGLDPHSSLIPRAQFEQAERQSARSVSTDPGLRLERDGPDLYVAAIHPQAKLAAQKLRPGDRVLAIDGQSTAGWPASRAAQQLAAPPGTKTAVALLVAAVKASKQAPAKSILLPRLELQWPTVTARAADRQLRVAVVRLPQFARHTAAEVRQGLVEVTALLGQPVRAAVLDMRGNGGGWLSEAVAVADTFASTGNLLTVRWRGMEEERYAARAQPTDRRMPLTVLVDGHCRSACEAVADALQGIGRALVAGQRTFGKGTLQFVEDAQRGPWSVLVTRGIYAGPSGRSVQGRGVEPDIAAGAEEVLLREVDLPRALTAGDDVAPHQTTLKTRTWLECMARPMARLAELQAYDPALATAVRAALCQEQPIDNSQKFLKR